MLTHFRNRHSEPRSGLMAVVHCSLVAHDTSTYRLSERLFRLACRLQSPDDGIRAGLAAYPRDIDSFGANDCDQIRRPYILGKRNKKLE